MTYLTDLICPLAVNSESTAMSHSSKLTFKSHFFPFQILLIKCSIISILKGKRFIMKIIIFNIELQIIFYTNVFILGSLKRWTPVTFSLMSSRLLKVVSSLTILWIMHSKFAARPFTSCNYLCPSSSFNF